MMGWLSRKRLFAIHGWLGVILGLPLYIICLAGACAVLAPDVDRLIHPEMRVVPPSDSGAEPLSWGRLLEKIEAACPGGEVILMNAEEDPGDAWSAVVNHSPKDSRMVFFDPFTGAVQGQRAPFSVQSFFRIFHKQFFILEGPFWPHGRVIVCAFSLVLLFSAATGLMFYKSWWRSLLRLRFGKGWRTFFSDLHRFAGVWTFLLAMLFAVTGLWYLMERLAEDFGWAEHEPAPQVPAEVRSLRPPIQVRLPLNELATRACASMKSTRISMITFGTQPGAPLGIHFKGGRLEGDGAGRVFLDPYSGAILEKIETSRSGWAATLESMVNPLHFGRFGGWLTKAIWTAAGFALSAGILTGTAIYWMRTRKSSGSLNRKGSRAALLLNLMILGLAGVSTVLFIRGLLSGPLHPAGYRSIGTAAVGPWTVQGFQEVDPGKKSGTVKFRFGPAGDPNFRQAFYGQAPDGLLPLKGSGSTLFGKSPGGGLNAELVVEAWDGTRHLASFADSEDFETLRPPAADGPSGVVWAIVAIFFLAAGAPAIIWLVRLW